MVDEPGVGQRLNQQADDLRQLKEAVTELTRVQLASGGNQDFWTKWGALIGFLTLAAALGGIWLSGQFSTNSRIDQLYPTILQQTKDIAQQTADISNFKGDLKAATDKLTAVSAQNNELFKRIAGLAETQAGLIAKQDTLFNNIETIKASVTKLVDDVSAQHDQLIRIDEKIDRPSPSIPQKKTELFEGGFVFASREYTNALKDTFGSRVDVVPIDNKSTDTFVRAFAKAAEESGKPNSFYIFTKDAGLAGSLKGILGAK